MTKAKANKSKYKGHAVEIREKDFDYEVKIDGKPIVIQRDSETGVYVCDETPYQPVGSIEELVKVVIDERDEHSSE